VDGCKDGSNEPGALEFDWLEVQLDSFRERGMQVSRVQPARWMLCVDRCIRTGLADGTRPTKNGQIL
jgi:hypothetical protein